MSILNKYLSMENQEVADARNEATTEREHVTTDAATEVDVETKAGEVNNDEAPLGDDSNVEKALDKAENQLEAAVESFQHDMKIIESVQNVKTGLDIRKVFPDLKPALETHYVSLEEDKEDNKDGFFMKIFKAIRDAIKWVWDKIVAVFKKIGEWLGLVKKSAEKKVEEAKNPEKVVVAKVNAEVQKEEVKKEQADKMPTDEEIQQLEKAAEESNAKTQEEFVQQLAKAGNVTPDVVKEKLKPTTEAIKAATGVEPIDPKATPKEQVKQIKAVKKIAEKAQEAPVIKEESDEPTPVVVTKENISNLSEGVKAATKDKKQLEDKVKYKLSKKAVAFFKKVPATYIKQSSGRLDDLRIMYQNLASYFFRSKYKSAIAVITKYMSGANIDEDTVVYNLIILASGGAYNEDRNEFSITISQEKKVTIDKIDSVKFTLADLSSEFLSNEAKKVFPKEINNETSTEVPNTFVDTTTQVTKYLELITNNITELEGNGHSLNGIGKIKSLPDDYKKIAAEAEAAIKKNPNHPIAPMLAKAIQLGIQNAGMLSSMFLRYHRDIISTYMEAFNIVSDPKHFKLLGKA